MSRINFMLRWVENERSFITLRPDLLKNRFAHEKIVDEVSDQTLSTVKPVLSDHSKRRQKLVFKTAYRLMQVKSIAEYSKGSILQYFRPSLSYYLSLRSFFCLFLSGRFRQVLLYIPSHTDYSSWFSIRHKYHLRKNLDIPNVRIILVIMRSLKNLRWNVTFQFSL